MADWGITLENQRYILTDLLHESLMSRVFLAQDTREDRQVVLKVVRPDIESSRRDEMIARFNREVQIMKAVQHPNIIHYYDDFTEGDKHFIVMEYVKGGSLRKRIEDQHYRFTSEEICRIGLAVAGALATAYDTEGVVHRDIKSSNILLTEAGVVRLSDFGIAHLNDPKGFSTQTHSQPGTLYYMAPEMFQRDYKVKIYCDMWSLGVVFFEMLTGFLPFRGENIKDTLDLICTGPLPPLDSRQFDLSPALKYIIVHMLQKAPERRFRSWWAVSAALDQALTDPSSAPTSPSIVSAIKRAAENFDPRPSAPLPEENATTLVGDPFRAGYQASRALLVAPTPPARDGMPASPAVRTQIQELTTLLKERYRFDDLQVLQGKTASLSAIRQALTNLQDRSEPEDRVLILYTGPAYSRLATSGLELTYLAAYDTHWVHRASFLPLDELIDTNFLRARHVFFVLDAPTLGPVDRAFTSDGTSFSLDTAMHNIARHILCAGPSHASTMTGNPAFLQMVLDGLNGQAQEHDVITADTLGRYVLNRTQRQNNNSYSPIHACLPGDQGGCMLFHVPASAYLPPVLLAAIRHEDVYMRQGAVVSLSLYARQQGPRIRRVAALEQLRQLARRDPSPFIRQEAQTALDDVQKTSTQTSLARDFGPPLLPDTQG